MVAPQAKGASLMPPADIKQSFETIQLRVMDVAALKRKCALLEGTGKLISWIGVPLLIVTLLEYALHLPFYLRLPVLPAVAFFSIWWGWRYVGRPLVDRYVPTRAALLVESARPDLQTRLVSALQLYPELSAANPRFDLGLIRALVHYAQESTKSDDFRRVVDQRPAKRSVGFGVATLIIWIGAILFNPAGMGSALASFGSAWGDLGDAIRKAAGAKIIIDPPGRAAFLVGSDVTLHARQQGFHRAEMQVLTRDVGASDWKQAEVQVSDQGEADFTALAVARSFECRFVAGTIESDPITVIVTERPRIVTLTVEYTLPDYVRRAPIVQPRSDGNLKALFGSTIVLTVEANKNLKSMKLAGSFLDQPQTFSVAGRYAKAVIRVDSERWLTNPAAEITEKYTLSMSDEYGYDNDDASREYDLVVAKDLEPSLSFVGLPHRTSADEPHVLQENLGAIGLVIKASDDWGISKVAIKYRIENLDNGTEKRSGTKEQQFALPRADIPQLSLLRLSEVDAEVGDRIVFWAEAEDAYNLEPSKGPHKVVTSTYRIAVVTQEEMFTEAVYRDDWSTQWYESLQVATLAKREIPARSSPESEPAAVVAAKLMEASQLGDSVRGSDQQLVQDYFDSLNVVRTEPK